MSSMLYLICYFIFFFFFNATATTEIYTLSLHDALPISGNASASPSGGNFVDTTKANKNCTGTHTNSSGIYVMDYTRSEEHTSELQSQSNLVCRLLLEKKKKKKKKKKQKNHKTIQITRRK